MKKQETAMITRRGAERVRGGHLWIYRSDVGQTTDIEGGAIVQVRDEQNRFIGQAFYSNRSEIALRLLTLRREKAIDRDWWRKRLGEAAARREGIERETNAYRLIFSEGDLLPSLILDKYADVFVLQTLSQGTERIKDLLVELIVEKWRPRALVERNDVRVRELEGLEVRTGVLYGDAPEEMEITQNGMRFIVSPLGGQKTGTFLDQRENQRAAQRVANGRALDCFTFNGGFALHLSPVCQSVTGIDISDASVSAARRNAELNNVQNVEFRVANVFDALREMEFSEERFDTIVLDPPAFAKNRSSTQAAVRGYKEINLRALKLLRTGGVLITCTCSYHIQEAMFLEIIAAASGDAHRRVQIIEKRTQASDHPVLVGVPETLYLKCLIARAI